MGVLYYHTLGQDALFSRLLGFYQSQLLPQTPTLILSVDLFGAPLSLAQNLGDGVWDLLYEPEKSSLDGTFSLLRNSLVGVSNSASSISRALGKVQCLEDSSLFVCEADDIAGCEHLGVR